MIRSRLGLVALVAACAFGLGVTAPAPASASTITFKVCQIYGNNYCIGAPGGLFTGAEIQETSTGRWLEEVTLNSYQGFPVWKLEFVNDPSLCVTYDTAYTNVVDAQPCSSYGVAWVVSGNYFINRYALEHGKSDTYLTGWNCSGCVFNIEPYKKNGGYQQFTLPVIVAS